MDKHNPPWPCIGQEGLKVFATTADQRYLLGAETFLRTHTPVTMRQFSPHHKTMTVHEDDLLAALLDARTAQPGNRVFILFGAAGSGKSELMRWLETRLSQEMPTRPLVRVARTELDVVRIAERFKHLLSQSYFDDRTHRRWQAARRKPRTLAKLLVIAALERLFDSDDTVNALYYRLLNVVQPNIERSLAAMDDPSEGAGATVELLSREDLAQIDKETVLDVPLEYEALRHVLLTVLREHLMEGIYLPDTLRLISADMARRDVRPILLIDDLVQSLNLFATDLLDYFITLEQGNWDVVIGLTPASFEGSERGRELLNRISHLDTIDDRVTKLWLSDQRGLDSYLLDEGNCVEFAWRYLDEYRRQNGMTCAGCPQYPRCAGLHNLDAPGSVDGHRFLTPLNAPATVRLFRALPEGKGKARYLIRSLRRVLTAAADGQNATETLASLSRIEIAARCADPHLARVCELYGPLVTDQRRVDLPAGVLAAFGYPAQARQVPVEPLLKAKTRLAPAGNAAAVWESDPDKQAVRDWLEGKAVNRQSLKRLHQGAARWLRAVCPTDSLHAEGVAQPHGALTWRPVYLDVCPPIVLEGIDDQEGILLRREVDHAAFRLSEYAQATGKRAAALSAELAQDGRLLPLMFAAMNHRHSGLARLEAALGMPVDQLAAALYVLWLVIEGQTEDGMPGLDAGLLSQTRAIHHEAARQGTSWERKWAQPIPQLYDDWFKLRENVYDGPRLARLLGGRTAEEILALLPRIPARNVDKDYRLGRERLSEALHQAGLAAEQILARRQSDEEALSPAGQALWARLQETGKRGVSLGDVAVETLGELRSKRPEQYNMLRVLIEVRDAG